MTWQVGECFRAAVKRFTINDMVMTGTPPTSSHPLTVERPGRGLGGRLVGRLVDQVAPNWFAAVMGTGIVATAATALPWGAAQLRPVAIGVWLLAAVLLAGIGALTAAQWITAPERARQHLRNPVLSHFHGAAPMAVLTVGAGTLLLGRDLIGLEAAVRIDWVLWSAGTLTGLATAVGMPYLLFTVEAQERHTGWDAAFGGWLMPVVPPMVSAATGALLLEHTPAGQPRLTMLMACFACFGVSLIASLVIITLIWGQLAGHGLPAARLVPTLWIVLGPLGQSVTAAGLLAEHAGTTFVDDPYIGGLKVFAVIFGVPTLGFALVWMCIAAALTMHTQRRTHLPFAPTWWSFTFPVGTCVTGAAVLGRLSGASVFGGLAVVLYAGLVAAWFVVGGRTLLAARRSGHSRAEGWAYSI